MRLLREHCGARPVLFGSGCPRSLGVSPVVVDLCSASAGVSDGSDSVILQVTWIWTVGFKLRLIVAAPSRCVMPRPSNTLTSPVVDVSSARPIYIILSVILVWNSKH